MLWYADIFIVLSFVILHGCKYTKSSGENQQTSSGTNQNNRYVDLKYFIRHYIYIYTYIYIERERERENVEWSVPLSAWEGSNTKIWLLGKQSHQMYSHLTDLWNMMSHEPKGITLS